MIMHIVSHGDWAQAQRDGVYRAPSLDTVGFIHFSRPEQVVATANRFYQGQTDLVLLVVDPDRLHAQLRNERPAEAPESSEYFPHLYGALNLDAIVKVVAFPPDAEGQWSALPTGVLDG
jgi:uncharacterized protein (DUF952 family)